MSLCRISVRFTVMGFNAHTLFGVFAGIAADIDVQIGDLGAFGSPSRVACAVADYPHAGTGPLALCTVTRWLLASAAHPFHENKAVVVDVIDRKGNLVSVAGEHNARSAAFVERGDAVAVFVVMGLIGELGTINHALAAGFSWWGWGVDSSSKGERFLAHGRILHGGGGANARRWQGFATNAPQCCKLIADAKLVVVKPGPAF